MAESKKYRHKEMAQKILGIAVEVLGSGVRYIRLIGFFYSPAVTV